VKCAHHSSLPGFDSPTDAVQHVSGDEGKAVRRGGADGFAVCGFAATLARYLEMCKLHTLTPVGASTEDVRVSA
jgi:hypothetical protein